MKMKYEAIKAKKVKYKISLNNNIKWFPNGLGAIIHRPSATYTYWLYY